MRSALQLDEIAGWEEGCGDGDGRRQEAVSAESSPSKAGERWPNTYPFLFHDQALQH